MTSNNSDKWLEDQIYSIKDVKKIIFLISLFSDPSLLEECGLPESKIIPLRIKLVGSLMEFIDMFYDEQRNDEESILEILLDK